jgi:uncharacterized protein
VRAALATPCARCLEPAAVDVDTEISLLLHPAPAQPAGKAGKHGQAAKPPPVKPTRPAARVKDDEYEFTSAEADADTYDGETVVLDGFVREALLLEVPNFPLCSEGCPGIRPADEPAPAEAANGAAPHVDPRLQPLQALRAKLEKKPQKKQKKE